METTVNMKAENFCAIARKISAVMTEEYVANSPYTVAGESYSAGRLYDKIGDTAEGTVLYSWGSDEQAASHRKREIFANRTHFCD